MELSPKDDFHLYVNHDWLLNTDIREGKSTESSFSEAHDKINEKALALLNDDTLTGHDAELCQSLYNAILDWDARDEAGIEPIKATVQDIQGIGSLDELSDFICDPERSMFVSTLTNCGNSISLDDSDRYVTTIVTDGFLLEDAAEYKSRTDIGDNAYRGNLYLSKAILTRLDYSESEIETMFDDVITFEGKIAEKSLTSADMLSIDYIDMINNVYSPADIKGLAKSYPLFGFLKSLQYEDADRYMVFQPNAIKRIDELYTEDNLETIKNY
ncbi:MAG: hypothetical protein IK123_07405, partial [Lachnospiraceae bacterium]|nr:hypothetical protein [Lachnospiraceae bacterium]